MPFLTPFLVGRVPLLKLDYRKTLIPTSPLEDLGYFSFPPAGWFGGVGGVTHLLTGTRGSNPHFGLVWWFRRGAPIPNWDPIGFEPWPFWLVRRSP